CGGLHLEVMDALRGCLAGSHAALTRHGNRWYARLVTACPEGRRVRESDRGGRPGRRPASALAGPGGVAGVAGPPGAPAEEGLDELRAGRHPPRRGRPPAPPA